MKAWTRAVTMDGHRIDVELDYTKAQPDVVVFTFGGPRSAMWRIGRDLLTEGLTARSGLGDVEITPSCYGLGVHLRSPSGEAYIVFERDEIAAFLKQTFRLVPQGTEYDGLDWNQLLPATGGAA